jgi:hypothetical protein
MVYSAPNRVGELGAFYNRIELQPMQQRIYSTKITTELCQTSQALLKQQLYRWFWLSMPRQLVW